MKRNNEKAIIQTWWYKVFLLISFVVFFYYGTYNTYKNSIGVWQNPKYTIGTIIGLSKNFRNPNHSLRYEYYKKGIRKENFLNIPMEKINDLKINYNSGRYLVVYDSIYKSGSELLVTCGELPDTLVAPFDGWRLPPVPECDKSHELYDSSVWYNWVFLKTIESLNIEVK